MIGRIGGTGTAVGGTGTSELGCQLRWRFLGGPEFMEKGAEINKTPKMKPKAFFFSMRNKIKQHLSGFQSHVPGLSPNSAVR